MEQRECDTVKTVPMFEHENALWHYNMCNKRMLIALCVVCVTFIVTILVFVHGYTVREKNWLDTLRNINAPAAEVTADGFVKQPNP